ncbi:MAG: helix-turn-helix domain-containing protein [Bacilli bacterium]|nr:helix-turn-helix domain-containing protein [Bacilli bacterium]
MFNGNKLKNLRIKKELKQEDLSTILNVSTSTIGMWEQGYRHPSDESITQMAKFFGVSTDYLLDNEPSEEFKEQTEENQELLKNISNNLQDPMMKILYKKTSELKNDKDRQIVLNIINSFIEEVDNK